NYTILGLAKRNIEALFNPAPIQNVRLLFFDIRRIELILSDQDLVDRIYINFCNPWPKGKHKKRRLTHPAQLERYKTFLKHGGEIRFKTDDTELFEDSISYFESTGFTITYLTRDLLHSNFTENITTEHEQFFTSQNIPIKFLIARLP
ncbi:MAG TPA: tRNA (guanosine(46)-N7)-methyltransferase TrmB, partial [Firmicutes bacterium]|nr:tRNA (guanosine(46)-N7)-methyltransferase TrmB [Bacillota bacterium]